MSENYIDVKPADVRVGDEVKVDGMGFFRLNGYPEKPVDLGGNCWEHVIDRGSTSQYVSIRDGGGYSTFRRSSIVAARRRVEVVPDGERCMHWLATADCSLRRGHVGDHVGYAFHEIGARETGRAPNPPKAETVHKCADAGCEVSAAKCGDRCSTTHAPKEPKREPGCKTYSPDASRWAYTNHENGFHVALGGVMSECARWPIEAPEPKVQPGTWRAPVCVGKGYVFINGPTVDITAEVYRSTGWSRCERKVGRRSGDKGGK